ncbi:autotransporter outer membrane beta-barrel domain-containing protein [Campylobacter jejuni]|uniref:autotransporter outer membrane beta-barrel domain-containing protein n=1 Tax=Campylobacter sp. CH165 TaxID=2498127 RepID=UPI001067B061|nr:autotransporter outer membrane beta-barrel domain-containing protein [Campylobacter jejuni]TEX90438.1 autotransporter outer membrane beta-barrel domain-containing protein [Campylobacter sp. CH165]EAI6923223.1 autotransporter outer membrane beta-barrel domain-containing protein [Campylobacter jejuni]EAI8132328.1 autotransporter outer membrane beta-barrel domain-containing protein [Campylobacter jejuni]EAI8148965.1 autotransporter outer membrane beta-barrel domain-containing protein [Campyloba
MLFQVRCPWGGGIRKSHLNSKKIVLSLATISFLASCADAALNSEIKTYDEANKNLKARSAASVYTPETRTDTTINSLHTDKVTITGSGSHSLIIETGGTLQPQDKNKVIYVNGQNSNTLTLTNLTNKGTIDGQVAVENSNGSFTGTITVNTFENKGQINGQIYMGIWAGKGTINVDKFDNSGTIVSNNKGVYFQGNTNIKSFTNSGLISGNQGVSLSGGTINSFNNNGTISGSSSSILVAGGNIKTLVNSGTIISNGNRNTNAGIKLESGGTIENIINTGTIQSNYTGIVVTYGKFGALTIENGGIVYGKYAGIAVGQWQTLGNLYIDGGKDTKKDGTVSGIYGDKYGISLETGSSSQKIELTNGGIIQGKVNGIKLGNAASLSGEMILSGEGSRVEGGSGSGISNESGKITGSIKVEDGATVTSSSGQAISNSGSGSITGGITVSGENTKLEGNIINTGNASIGSDIKIENGAKVEGGLVNQGNGSISGSVQVSGGSSIDSITNTGNGAISGSITVDEDSKLDSITNTSTSDTGISGSITNNSDNKLEISNSGNIGGKIESTGGADMVISNSNGGTISGGISSSGSGNTSISNSQGSTINNGITVSGSAQVEISNQGSVGKDSNGNTVTNNGSGSVGIKDWVVSTDKETGKLDTVVVGGSGKDNVKVENITVDQSNVNLDELGDINNIISGVNQGNIGNIGTNGGGEISLSYDPLTGKLSTDFNLNASISGATFRSLISTTTRRSTFIDNVMGNSMQSFSLASSSKSQSIAMSEKGNLYADASDYIKSDLNNGNYGSNKEHSLFILPYTSSQNVELSLNEESKGHTKGTIIGYSTLKDSGIYGVYAGYEDTKMGSTYFDINNRTYYAGLKYFNTLFTTEKGQEVYIKAQGKAALIKNDLTKKIGNNEAKAEPNSYAYGVNTALGMNFISNKDIFSPEVGLAYEGGYTEAFSMKDTIGQATVQGGERTYTNYLNLFSTKTSFTWFRDWLPNLKTSVELGAKFNINPKVEAEARFGNIKVSDEFDLPRVQKFVSTSFIVPVNEAFYFSLNYNGMFDKDGNTHTGFAQFNYLW